MRRKTIYPGSPMTDIQALVARSIEDHPGDTEYTVSRRLGIHHSTTSSAVASLTYSRPDLYEDDRGKLFFGRCR